MDIEQTAIIDKAHDALANGITQDMGVYLSPSNEVILFGPVNVDTVKAAIEPTVDSFLGTVKTLAQLPLTTYQ